MKKRILISLMSLLAVVMLRAQDIHFTQFYSTPLHLNPAFAGADVCSRVSFAYRNQWPGISTAYRTSLFSVDHYFQTQSIGAGLVVASDVAGSGDLRTTIVNAQVAYEARLTKQLYMRLGAQPGLLMRSINYNKLLFGDQIARGGAVPTVEDPTMTRTNFDIGAGALFYSLKYWAGVSFNHLNKPNESLFPELEAILPVRTSVHAGARYALNPEAKEEVDKKFISPALHYRHQNRFDQLDIGLYYTQYIFSAGMWYRGLPGIKSYAPGYANNDALSFIVGVRTPRFNFGYSYDVTISRLARATGGAHEVTISYQLCKLKKKRKSRLIVPCPKF